MGKPRKYTSRELTNHVRQLAAEAHDWSMEDGAITKGEALARLLWKKALGYTEDIVTDEGEQQTVHHKPEVWAIQLLYDRLEGKTPQAVPEDDHRVKAADRVRELAANRINHLAEVAVGENVADLKQTGPPKRTRKDTTDGHS